MHAKPLPLGSRNRVGSLDFAWRICNHFNRNIWKITIQANILGNVGHFVAEIGPRTLLTFRCKSCTVALCYLHYLSIVSSDIAKYSIYSYTFSKWMNYTVSIIVFNLFPSFEIDIHHLVLRNVFIWEISVNVTKTQTCQFIQRESHVRHLHREMIAVRNALWLSFQLSHGNKINSQQTAWKDKSVDWTLS